MGIAGPDQLRIAVRGCLGDIVARDQAAAEGWNPADWRRVAKSIAVNTSWIAPTIPVAADPSPFHGTPAV